MATPDNNPDEQLRQLILGDELTHIQDLQRRQQAILDRVGDDRRLIQTIQHIIVDILREARSRDHDRLAAILAPLVLASLREEIRNSRDMMVEALHPIAGRLVAAAVRNAFTELLRTIEERLNQTLSYARLKIRVRAWLTGQSAAALMLEAFPIFDLESILLIHRPSGLLIAARHHHPGAAASETAQDSDTASKSQEADGDLVGSLLTAIMAFTKETFAPDDNAELRTLEVDNGMIALRTSPTLLLAAKTSGPMPIAFQRRFDDTFVQFTERWGGELSGFNGMLDNETATKVDEDLSFVMTSLMRDDAAETKSPSRTAYIAAGAILAVVLAWWLWLSYGTYQEDSWVADAEQVIAETQTVRQFPLRITIGAKDPPTGWWQRTLRAAGWPYERRVTVSGLVPDHESATTLHAALRAVLTEPALSLQVVPLQPEPQPDDPLPLQQARALVQADPNLAGFPLQFRYDTASQTLFVVGLVPDATTLQRLQQNLSTIRSEGSAVTIKTTLTPLRSATAEPSPLALLQSECTGTQIRFLRGIELLQPETAARQIDRLANRLRSADPGIKLRLSGYSDRTGGIVANSGVSYMRAEFVAEALQTRGIEPDRLVAVGRSGERLLNQKGGDGNENRRVECELIKP